MVKKFNGWGPHGSQIVAASTGVGKAWQLSVFPCRVLQCRTLGILARGRRGETPVFGLAELSILINAG